MENDRLNGLAHQWLNGHAPLRVRVVYRLRGGGWGGSVVACHRALSSELSCSTDLLIMIVKAHLLNREMLKTGGIKLR